MAPLPRSFLAASLLCVLVGGAAAALAQAPGADLEADTVDESVRALCVALDAARGPVSGGPLIDDVEWRIRVAPMECSADEWSVYLRLGNVGRDATDAAPIQRTIRHSQYGHLCGIAKGMLVHVLAAPAHAGPAMDAGAAVLAALVAGLDVDALVPGFEVAVPSTPGVQAEPAVDASPPAPDDLMVDSRGTATRVEGALAHRVETESAAGPAQVQASVDSEAVADALEPDIVLDVAERVPVRREPPPLTEEAAAPPAARVTQPPRAPAAGAAADLRPVAAAPAEALAPAMLHAAGAPSATLRAPASLRVVAVAGAAAAALALAATALYHRLTDRQMRSAGPRARILEALAREPGLCAADVARRVGVHRTTAQYHLRLLAGKGAVAVRTRSGQAAHFLPGSPALDEPGSPPALRARSARAILAAARASPGTTLGEAAAAAGVSLPAASQHVRRLREARLLEVRADGRFRRLFATG